MNEQKNNGRGIFYGVIGVATLVVAIIGATFAYFTATQSANNVITGNMATIQFGLNVTKVTHVDETKGGMIPMSNNMVDAAVVGVDPTGGNNKVTCTDANGNAVCQIWKIVVTNTGSASLYLDGYVTLTGGSGVPEDAGKNATNKTTMRWAQVFCTGTETDEITGCSTAGSTTTGATGSNMTTFASLANTSDTTGFNNDNVVTAADSVTAAITAKGTINNYEYDIINKNFIRISDHVAGATYSRTTDATSALVFNQYLDAANDSNTDEQTFYVVVWLSENGHNQTATQTPQGSETANPAAERFFLGSVVFNSAQGSEVTATFTGYTAVQSDQVQTAGNGGAEEGQD